MTKPIASYIDYTILEPTATRSQINELNANAKQEHFASVCINPCWVSLCAAELADSAVNVCTVIGFPLGSMTTGSKVYEAQDALSNGADEIDMVMNIGQFKGHEYDDVTADITRVAETVHGHGKILKVIIEAGFLDDDEIVKACQLAMAAKADFVKTSTGFLAGGATVHAVSLMRQTVGSQLQVKAAGKIHSYEDAQQLVAAGADRLGASAGMQIVAEEAQALAH